MLGYICTFLIIVVYLVLLGDDQGFCHDFESWCNILGHSIFQGIYDIAKYLVDIVLMQISPSNIFTPLKYFVKIGRPILAAMSISGLRKLES